ncbi:hypothetical protein CASFOL_010934 [Castilleja foliolosa]|uniref:F-box domain-containing protein n=1 Tax=Castilleja foliolosa TaxID=1961234 RepID=A0ABD3DXT9_9LAMI
MATATIVKLLVTSADCDPKAELSFSGHHHAPLIIEWNDVVDALDGAKYSFATRRLPQPQNTTTAPRNPKSQNFPTKVAYLSLIAAKKVALFYGGDYTGTNYYQITYDDSLMNDLPSHVNLKGLPRFHLFSSLPADLQWAVAEQCDAVGFARMRCVNRHLSRMWWNPKFNAIGKYSNPDRSNNKQRAAEKKPNSNVSGSSSGGEGNCSGGNGFLRLASTICLAVVLCYIGNEIRSAGGYVYEDEDEEFD